MHSRRRFIQEAAGLALVPALGAAPAFAASDYPTRPIHIIIGFPAGSGADIFCRWYAHKLEGVCGQPVVLDNKPGASGNLATRFAAHQPADGYSLMLNANSSMAGSKFLFKELGFDAVKDFVPITSLAEIAFCLVVSPKSPYNSVAELTKHLQEKKDNIFAYNNPTGLMSAELYKQLAHVPAKRVAYRSAADAMRDINNGTIDFMFMDGTFASGQIHAGQIKALGVITPTRVDTFPQVPTMKEQGLAFNFAPWWAAYAPAGTPQPIVDKLEVWFKQIASEPDTAAFLKKIAAIPLIEGQAETKKHLLAEFKVWPPLVKAAGIEPR